MVDSIQKRAVAALKDKLVKGCPFCGKDAWAVGEIVNFPIFRADGALVVGGPQVPVLMVVCTNCGGLAPFSVVALGLDKPQEPSDG